MRASWGFPAETTLTVHPLYVYVYPFIENFYPFLGDSITFTCILQRKLNLSHSFFSVVTGDPEAKSVSWWSANF